MPRRNLSFPRSHRVTRDVEIKRIAAQGKRFRTGHLEVRTIASPLLHPRVGLIVPKYGHTAVERNQLKRRLREVVRTELLPTLPRVDVVVRARPSAYVAKFSELVAELKQLPAGITRLFL